MADDTDILGLPLILPGQAQKHVTHNEAIAALDVMVQLAVLDSDRQSPPVTALAGDRHVVAAGGLGEWSDQSGKIAVLRDGGWIFYTPNPGWQAYDLSRKELLIFDGLTWSAQSSLGLNFASLGIGGAMADATNRLAVSAAAVLLNHAGAGHQLKINKQSPSDTASLLFQTNYSGRAEMGTTGSDGFSVKVSADGSTWHQGVSFAAGNGLANFPNGLTRAGSVLYGRDNLLGAVSFASGLPAGAVFEQGSNANGQYLRLADGTMICTSVALTVPNVATALGAGYRSASVNWSYPAAFVAGSTPVVQAMVEDADCWVTQNAPSATLAVLRVAGFVSKATSLALRATAIGRWA